VRGLGALHPVSRRHQLGHRLVTKTNVIDHFLSHLIRTLRLHWTPGELLVILMTMSEVSSLAETKAHLSELVARVGDQHERITVTVHGRPAAVLLAVDDLESLEETRGESRQPCRGDASTPS
jgi:prevent-host-death family protein